MAKWNPRLVGIFVLGGLALATLLVTLLGGAIWAYLVLRVPPTPTRRPEAAREDEPRPAA